MSENIWDHVAGREPEPSVPWEQSAPTEQIALMRHNARIHMAVLSFGGGFKNNQDECPHPKMKGSVLLQALGKCPRCSIMCWSNWFKVIDAETWPEV